MESKETQIYARTSSINTLVQINMNKKFDMVDLGI